MLSSTTAKEIRASIQKDDLAKALQLFQDGLKDPSYSNKLSLIANQYNGFINQIMKGVLNVSEQQIQKNKIVQSFLFLLNQVTPETTTNEEKEASKQSTEGANIKNKTINLDHNTINSEGDVNIGND